MFSDKTIFFSALDWGLGHATRSVPLIRELEKKNKIILGVTPLTSKIFNEEFPHLEKIEVPAYNIRYSFFLPLWLKLALQAPRIFNVIRKENKFLQRLLSQQKIDVVISDNRFGLHSKDVYCVFITHQVFLKASFMESFSQGLNKNYIKQFDELWIPDFEKESESLSAELSHGVHFHPNVKYIGPQSRLKCAVETKKNYDFLVMLSGPEPQYSLLEQLLLKKADLEPAFKFAFVSQRDQDKLRTDENHIKFFTTRNKDKLSAFIASSDKIICRSGYSTLMDLYLLNKKDIILIPTPGQTEQEYLAEYWQKKFNAKIILQKDLAGFKFGMDL